jgi:Tfp pilus assembly protein PilP
MTNPISFTLASCAAFVLFAAAMLGAQAPAKPAGSKPAQPAAPPAKPQPLPTIDPGYAYEPDGRRDPFLSLLGRGEEGGKKAAAARPAGISGLLIGEVTVKGVLRDRDGFIALLHAPDNKTYTVKVGDKLMDGSVKSINQDQVIFSQDVSDPLSLVKQREVPKPVRQAEGRG